MSFEGITLSISFKTDFSKKGRPRSEQKEQSDLGLHCMSVCLSFGGVTGVI